MLDWAPVDFDTAVAERMLEIRRSVVGTRVQVHIIPNTLPTVTIARGCGHTFDVKMEDLPKCDIPELGDTINCPICGD